MKAVGDIIGLPEDRHVFALFAVGSPAETKKQQDRFDAAKIHYIE